MTQSSLCCDIMVFDYFWSFWPLGGARIMINLNLDILFDIVTSKWLVKMFARTMIRSTSPCVYHRKVLILRIVIAKCLVKGCTGHDHPALTYPCPPWPDISSGPPWSLIRWSYQSLWSTICSVLVWVEPGFLRLLIIEKFLIRFAISAR